LNKTHIAFDVPFLNDFFGVIQVMHGNEFHFGNKFQHVLFLQYMFIVVSARDEKSLNT